MKRILGLMLVLVLLFAGCAGQNSVPSATAGGAEARSEDTVDVSKAQESSEIAEPSSSSEDEAAPSHEVLAFDTSGDVIEIKEKMFIAQTNDIYLNADDYLGKTIKYEGMYSEYSDEFSEETYRYVIRYGPGCCGTDGNAGFEIVWDGELPQDNDWVEAVGVLEEYGENGWQFLRLRLNSLTVLDERGAEYVAQ